MFDKLNNFNFDSRKIKTKFNIKPTVKLKSTNEFYVFIQRKNIVFFPFTLQMSLIPTDSTYALDF